MYVKDWMSGRPVSIPDDATVAEARVLFESKGIRHLPVVADGKVVGIFTSTDQLRVHEDHQHSTVQRWMSKDPVRIEPEATIESAALLLREHKIGCLPVVDSDGGLVGIITESDVLDLLVEVLGFRSGGARMVLEATRAEREQTVDKIVDLVREHELKLHSIVVYHPRGDADQIHVVARISKLA